MPPAFLVKKAILTRRPRGSLTGWDDFPLVLSSISEGDNCTDIAQSYNIKINDQVPGPQLNARGVYTKINSFDQAFFQSQSRLIDKIQCASLYLFMVGTELFHLSHDYSSTYGLSSFGRFILFRNRSSTGG